MSAPKSRAELARERAEEEKRRIAALEQRAADDAGDVLNIAGANAGTSTQSVPKSPQQPAEAKPPAPLNGPTAHGPITETQKVDRQGINLRPSDRERVYAFDLFCMRMKLGKKKGLTLYARAGMQLLEQYINDHPEEARELLKSI